MDVRKLHDILARNYAAIGWKLYDVEQMHSGITTGMILRGHIQCPCGGEEYFNLIFTHGTDERVLAKNILEGTASRAHLQKDIDEGKIPAMDVDKHCFNGELV